MKYDPASRLARYVDSLLERNISPAEAVDFFHMTSLAIEKGNAKTRFPTLAMYCDWAQHSDLSSNTTAFELLARLDEAIQSAPANLTGGICEAFGFATLRREFIELFSEKNIPTDFFTQQRHWESLIGTLLDDIQRRPINFVDDIQHNLKAHGREVYDKLVAIRQANGNGLDTIKGAVVLFLQPGDDEMPIDEELNSGFYWALTVRENSTGGLTEIRGPMLLTEPADKFDA